MTHYTRAWLLLLPTHLLSHNLPIGNAFPHIAPFLQRNLHSLQKQHISSSSSIMSTNSNEEEGISDIGEKLTESKPSNNCSTVEWKTRIDKSNSKSRRVRGSNYIQLATVDLKSNEPRCRTVVFRGFQKMLADLNPVVGDPSKCFKMITDQRSKKVSESKVAEVVWWFSQTKEQYRIRGTLQYINEQKLDQQGASKNNVRIEQWEKLTDAAREQFYWNDPAKSYETDADVPKGGRDSEGIILKPPDNFLIVLLYPFHVNYLCLKNNYRQVDTLVDGDWGCCRMNP